MTTVTDALYRDPRLAGFYDLDNDWGTDSEFCRNFAKDARLILDLGCGTGRLSAALAVDGCTVVGVDPAAAMLDIARARHGSERVSWIEEDARHLRLRDRFDLVLLAGHAFQVFLTDDDQRAILATIAGHLAPKGRFIFDSRNPAAKEWLEWGPGESRRRLYHPRFGETEAWNDAQHDPATGIVSYQTYYRNIASGQTMSAGARIRFTSQAQLTALIAEAGLKVEKWLGDWNGHDFTAQSPEIIPLGGTGR